MKLTNAKITCMPGLILFYFLNLSKNNVLAKAAMDKHCDDNILHCSTMMSPSTVKFPNEHMKTKQNITKPLFFISLMVNWAKHKTTDHLQVRLKPLWGRKEQTCPLFLPQQKEGTVMKSAGKFNMFPNRTPQKMKKQNKTN